jgi:hypothetical protein
MNTAESIAEIRDYMRELPPIHGEGINGCKSLECRIKESGHLYQSKAIPSLTEIVFTLEFHPGAEVPELNDRVRIEKYTSRISGEAIVVCITPVYDTGADPKLDIPPPPMLLKRTMVEMRSCGAIGISLPSPPRS